MVRIDAGITSLILRPGGNCSAKRHALVYLNMRENPLTPSVGRRWCLGPTRCQNSASSSRRWWKYLCAIWIAFLTPKKKNPEPVKDVLSCRRMYQLVSMTALYTAVKITEFQILDPRLLSSISKGNYSEEDIEKTESSMLRALQWRVNPPTATSFLRHLIALLPVGESVDAETRNKIFENATHQVEASVLEYELMTTRPSVVAYAALLNSMKGIGGQRIPPPEWVSFLDNVAVILDFDDKSKSEVIEIRERLLGILFESSNFVSKPGKEKLRHCHSSSPHSPRCVLSVTNHNQGDIK